MNSMVSTTCPISGETAQEEHMNYVTHLIGFLFSCIGTSLLLWISFSSGDLWDIISCSVFCMTLISMYAASTLYHRCKLAFRKKTWKIIDHTCIYLFIAGSYTPLTLGPLRSFHGKELLFVVWAIAIFGILFKIIAIDSFKRLSLFSYLLLGWLIAFSFPTLANELSFSGLIWLITGGISYTLGTIFYAWKALPFSHAIWHLFVLGGSFCHYCTILDFFQKRANSM